MSTDAADMEARERESLGKPPSVLPFAGEAAATALARAILLTAEELYADAMISDSNWNVLVKRVDDKQVFKLTMLIGQLTGVAYFQNALRLRLPDGSSGLLAR